MILTTQECGRFYTLTIDPPIYSYAEHYLDYCNWRMGREFSYLSGLVQFVKTHCPDPLYALLRKEMVNAYKEVKDD